MEAVAQVRDTLQPRLEALLELLEAENPAAAGYFGTWRECLESLREEDDVLLFFVEQLAPCAFVADEFMLSTAARSRLDGLLAAAQDIAATFSADDTQAH